MRTAERGGEPQRRDEGRARRGAHVGQVGHGSWLSRGRGRERTAERAGLDRRPRAPAAG